VDAAVKASAKKAEEERRKAAGKERQELEKMLALQLEKVSVVYKLPMHTSPLK
jgi:hypothetical protein